jgi:hypothetical protein
VITTAARRHFAPRLAALALLLSGPAALRAQGGGPSAAPRTAADTLPLRVLRAFVAAINRNDAHAIAALYDSTVSYAVLAADSTGVPRRMTADTVRAIWTRYLASQKRPLRITLLRTMVLGPTIAWEYRIVDNNGTKRAIDVLEVRRGKIVGEWEGRRY